MFSASSEKLTSRTTRFEPGHSTLNLLDRSPLKQRDAAQLVRKPGAFARYRYREELFPSLVFRRAYDSLRDARGERADVEYVRILHLAASTMQARVEAVLDQLLRRGERPDFAAVRAMASPERPLVPEVHIPPPDLAVYDRLLVGGA